MTKPMVGKAHGAYVVKVNLRPMPLSHVADETHYGKAGEILPRLLGPLAQPHTLTPSP
jgi:hypothetical protein